MADAHSEVKLKRVAKGPKPQYFADPATDKLLTMVLEVTQELSVAQDRIDTLERLLEAAKVLPASAVDSYRPTAEIGAERAVRRDAMLARIFRASTQEFERAVGHDATFKEQELAEILS